MAVAATYTDQPITGHRSTTGPSIFCVYFCRQPSPSPPLLFAILLIPHKLCSSKYSTEVVGPPLYPYVGNTRSTQNRTFSSPFSFGSASSVSSAFPAFPQSTVALLFSCLHPTYGKHTIYVFYEAVEYGRQT